MKFKIHVKMLDYKGDHWEEYDEDIKPDDAKKWAENLISRFNNTLRPSESPREVLAVEIIDANASSKHKWDKQITGMSAMFRGHVVDIMRCTKCGVTGKKYGLSSTVKMDSKFKKKVFRDCDKAREYLRVN